MNLSTTTDHATARTCVECAAQRAEYIARLGVKRVLELCVGPSLRDLVEAYAVHGIQVTGNDIDERWREYYPDGSWLMGDALELPYAGFDVVVFAPPLTRGCTGTREDSLRTDEVQPPYRSFIDRLAASTIGVLVLPGRAMATRRDRAATHELLGRIDHSTYHTPTVIPLVAGRRQIVKYHDIVLIPRS